MSPSDFPGPDVPSPLAVQRVIRCLTADVAATKRARGRVRPARTNGDLSYLDRLIHKPWGSEFRVYEDALMEVWCLHIAPERRTSLHCHPHKYTALLCLEGKGALSTCTGVQYVLQPGVVLHIEPGAYHRSASLKGALTLVEVEMPKDKLDLLRLEDDYRDVVEPYEGAVHAALRIVQPGGVAMLPLALQPFVQRRIGAQRRARLRAPSPAGRHRFAVETGALIRGSSTVVFAIALEQRTAASREITVLGPDRTFAAVSQTHYLTIRTA